MIVGFCGPAGSGKTFAANALIASRGFKRLRFAGPLKAMLRALGLTDDDIEGSGKALPHPRLSGRTPRQAMQWLGTEWGRDLIGPEFWVDLWKAEARVADRLGYDIAVEDVRFANEAAAIRALGGDVWRIVRPGVRADTGHASERIEFEPDGELLNDGEVFVERVLSLLPASGEKMPEGQMRGGADSRRTG